MGRRPAPPPLPLLSLCCVCRYHFAYPPAQVNTNRYRDVLSASLAACRKLEGTTAAAGSTAPASAGSRVALFAEPGADYVAGQFGTWLHNGISVPLCLSHPDRQAAGATDARMQGPEPSRLRGPMGAPALSIRLSSFPVTSLLLSKHCCYYCCRELQYVLEDAQVSSVLASEQHAERLYRLAQVGSNVLSGVDVVGRFKLLSGQRCLLAARQLA